MKKFLALIAIACSMAVQGNNVTINNITVNGSDISFTLSWENSWNTTNNIDPLYPNNWDGVWLFVKYQNAIDNLWKHAKLSNNNADHSVSGGLLQADAVTDSLGVFIRRSGPGFGNISNVTVTLKMGSLVGSGSFNFKVFGIEMVHIPSSSFWVGDGSTASANFMTNFQVTAASQTSGFVAGGLFPGSALVPNTFPLGVNGYYCMKYEASVEQWVDFLNTLTYDQQAVRTDIAPNAAVNTFAYTNNVNTIADNVIRVATSGLNNTLPAVFGADIDGDGIFSEANDGLNMAVSITSKADMLAYLDWSGLRPMTEFEFEKACRGTRPSVLGEYAWGSTTHDWVNRSQLSNLGTAGENYATVTNGRVMASSGAVSTQGPARCGVFATGSTGRESSGAGFYGNMELSGNCQELVVYVDAAGVNYTGNHGDGNLTTAGEANVSSWPDGNAVAANGGIGMRGGEYFQVTGYTSFIKTSYRRGNASEARGFINGIRGVRSMP
jgi:formylglycine-generating enzyme required for sulfatase activity